MNFVKKYIWIFFFVVLFTDYCSSTVIQSYKEKIFINPDGSANIIVNVNIKRDTLKEILLPFRFKSCEDLKFDGNPKNEINVITKNDIKYISIVFGDSQQDSLGLEFSYKITNYYDFNNAEQTDFRNLNYQYKFVNTTYNQINVFSAETILPEGFNITSIESSVPKLSEKNPIPPYELSKNGSNYSVIIKSSNLKIGDYALIQIRFKEANRSKILLFGLIAVMLLYLIFYRDVLKKEVV
jgi:hypothetical protein